jgi:hypothetical protein
MKTTLYRKKCNEIVRVDRNRLNINVCIHLKPCLKINIHVIRTLHLNILYCANKYLNGVSLFFILLHFITFKLTTTVTHNALLALGYGMKTTLYKKKCNEIVRVDRNRLNMNVCIKFFR